jgi:hypothetical protein
VDLSTIGPRPGRRPPLRARYAEGLTLWPAVRAVATGARGAVLTRTAAIRAGRAAGARKPPGALPCARRYASTSTASAADSIPAASVASDRGTEPFSAFSGTTNR